MQPCNALCLVEKPANSLVVGNCRPLPVSDMNRGLQKAKAQTTIARIAAHTFTLQMLQNTAC
jgi:hypothetical protein